MPKATQPMTELRFKPGRSSDIKELSLQYTACQENPSTRVGNQCWRKASMPNFQEIKVSGTIDEFG